jgi:hypothetical protein
MTKYHINDKGNPCPCTATVRQCPYGGPEDHFTSERDARAYYEVEMKISQLLKNELLGGTVVETKKTDSKIFTACDCSFERRSCIFSCTREIA